MSATDWQHIFNDVKRHAAAYLDAAAKQGRYKNGSPQIDFNVDDLQQGISATAKKCADRQYQIILSAGLVAKLRTYSRSVVEQEIIFGHMQRTPDNAKALAEISDYLFYLWLEFIVFHEWAHIIRGHLEIGRGKRDSWHEIGERDNDIRSSVDDETVQRLEGDADGYAAAFTIARFSTISHDHAKRHYALSGPEVALSDFVRSSLLLFKLIEEIEDETAQRKRHPDPYIRAFFLQSVYLHKYAKCEGLPQLSSAEVERIIATCMNDFYLNYCGLNAEMLTQKNMEAVTFMESVDKVIKDLGLDQLRLTVSG